jgi:hypothetical protein
MTLAMAIDKRLESEIARVLEIMGHVRDRPDPSLRFGGERLGIVA